MADIFDFRSRQKMKGQDTTKNDAEAAEFGAYVGVLPKHEAKRIRDVHGELQWMREQIDGLIEAYNQKYEGVSYMKANALVFLGVEPDSFSARQDLYVDEEGHCWVVNLDHPDTKTFIENKEGQATD